LASKLGAEVRNARVVGYGAFAARAESMGEVRAFLDEAGYADARRVRMQGDASTRIFERLTRGEQTTILMNAPRRPDGPPVRDGKPYSAIAHLAEDVVPYVAIAAALRQRNVSAPKIVHADIERGLIIMEDLGEERIVQGDPPAPIEERYQVTVDLLAKLHREPMPEVLNVAPGLDYRVPRYDMEAFLIEAELLLDWYLSRDKSTAPATAREEFVALWREALAPAIAAPPSWVLRDYHSPNLLWLPKRVDTARIGVLDFQDMLIGPAPYDVGSLLQDARVDVSETIEVALLGRYVRSRRADDPQFDVASFTRLYATMTAQRATKILGIFARLDQRDGKPQYLRHMPRLWSYLQRSLAHPALASLKAWYDANVSPPDRL
jgi:aminoglycoside/choline kinase family phosphotransferase